MIELRPYQEADVQAIREAFRAHRRVLYVLPTGGGKTVLFSYVASRHIQVKGRRVYVLVHRAELVDQVYRSLLEFNVTPGIIAAEYMPAPYKPVQIASVQTLIRRLEQYREPTLIIVDEAHHAAAGTSWGKIIAGYKNAYVLGVTATPTRLSGEGLRESFDVIVPGPTVKELVEQGYLAPPRVFAPDMSAIESVRSRMGDFIRGDLALAVDKPRITGDAVDHYLRLAKGRQAIVFCVSVEHATHVAEQFRQAGVPAESIDGQLSIERRSRIVGDFRAGRINVLVSCDLISEGFDVPNVHCGVLLRPTQSLGLHLQQCGRILRPAAGKPHALILDHAGNTLRHGLPDDDREWSLDGTPEDEDEDGEAAAPSVRICGKCFAAAPSRTTSCPSCGTPFPVKPRRVGQDEGELKEMTPEQIAVARAKREQMKSQGRARTLDALTEIGKLRGMKYPAGWARHVFAARQRRGAA